MWLEDGPSDQVNREDKLGFQKNFDYLMDQAQKLMFESKHQNMQQEEMDTKKQAMYGKLRYLLSQNIDNPNYKPGEISKLLE